MIAILLFFVVSFLILLYVYSPFRYWKNKNIPHPQITSYLFGNIGQAILFKKSVAEVYDEIYNAFPGLSYIGFYKLWTPSILLRDPEVINQVLVNNFNSFGVNEIFLDRKKDSLFATNPFFNEGPLWKQNRSRLSPSFTAKKVREMYPLIELVAKNLVNYINNEVVGINNGMEGRKLFVKYTTDVVTSCALGVEANSFINSDSESLKMIRKILSPAIITKIKLYLVFNFPYLTKLLKIRLITDDADTYYRNMVQKSLEYREKNKIYRGDFLDSMIELKKKAKSDSFTDSDVAGHVFSFITEGTETPAITLLFTLYELALQPDIQSKLRSEIDDTIEKYQGTVNFDAIMEMKYLDQIIKENLRKNTVAPVLRKVCTNHFTLNSPDGNGPSITVEPGTPIIIPAYSLHHDPKYYPEPNVFDPSRFSTDDIERSTCIYMPFGEGPRICLGFRFGMAQVKIAMVHIISSFEIRLNPKTVVPYRMDPHYLMLEAKDGLWFDFHKI